MLGNILEAAHILTSLIYAIILRGMYNNDFVRKPEDRKIIVTCPMS